MAEEIWGERLQAGHWCEVLELGLSSDAWAGFLERARLSTLSIRIWGSGPAISTGSTLGSEARALSLVPEYRSPVVTTGKQVQGQASIPNLVMSPCVTLVFPGSLVCLRGGSNEPKVSLLFMGWPRCYPEVPVL